MQLPIDFGAPAMRVAVLGSGSAGNAVVVRSGRGWLLIDAGFSCRELERRLAAAGVDPDAVQGVVVTHEHGDHCRGAARFVRRHRVPVYATRGTLAGMRLGEDAATQVLQAGRARQIGDFEVVPFAVPHDAREPIGVVVENRAGGRVGLVADLGRRSRRAWGHLRDLDALILETNHDLDMLREGPYPWPLKQRVAGGNGHLSNQDAAEGLAELLCDRLRTVVLYHLSQINNLPALAHDEVATRLAREGSRAEIVVTSQRRPTPWIDMAPAVPAPASAR